MKSISFASPNSQGYLILPRLGGNYRQARIIELRCIARLDLDQPLGVALVEVCG
jgi:hypothetical protein